MTSEQCVNGDKMTLICFAVVKTSVFWMAKAPNKWNSVMVYKSTNGALKGSKKKKKKKNKIFKINLMN